MAVDHFKLSHQLLQRVFVLLLILRPLVGELPVDLMQQRVQFQVEVLKPLKYLNLLVFVVSPELVLREIEEDGVGLADGSFRGKQNEGIIFFGDFLGTKLFVEELQGHQDLLKVLVVSFGEIKAAGHSIYLLLLYLQIHFKSSSQHY